MPAPPSFIPARPAPFRTRGLGAWLRRECFGSVWNGVATLLVAMLVLWALAHLMSWGVVHAVWAPDANACQAARGSGACWGVVAEKHRLILFGRYPFAEQWRPLVATLGFVALLVASTRRRLWRPALAWAWVVAVIVGHGLMAGGVAGLSRVGTDLWGGLPLTLLLAGISIVLAFPLAIVVALGRRSELPAIRSLCIVYIEAVRGVPLISVLFMASFLFPLFLPPGRSPDVLLRVLAGITLFSAAYLAEVIRGGLQALPRSQVEAAQSLGLGFWQTQRKVVLPQALATVLPGIVNNFIGVFKDSSLVTIVSLYELTGALELALNSDADWRPFKIEGYLFITFVYFVCCFAMSRYSLSVERRLSRSRST